MQLCPEVSREQVDVLKKRMAMTHENCVETSVYVLPIVQFLVNMLLNTNAASRDRFLPVNLLSVSQ